MRDGSATIRARPRVNYQRSNQCPTRFSQGHLDPSLAVVSVDTLDRIIGHETASARFRTVRLSMLALLGMLLASVGLYGVVAYSTEQRTSEIAVRLVIGAHPGGVMRMVLGEAATLAVAGIVIGLVAALVATKALTTLLDNVAPSDPISFLASAALLIVITLAASCVPAYRAARTEPMAALRID